MLLIIEGMIIDYPSKTIYPEQIQIMYILKKIFDKKAHAIMGIPSGIGLPDCVFSFFWSYRIFSEFCTKILYWTSKELDTHSIIDQWDKLFIKLIKNEKYLLTEIIISGLFEKKKLCIEPRLKEYLKNDEVEDFCESLTIPFISKKIYFNKLNKNLIKKIKKCKFFENQLKKPINKNITKIWSLKKLKKEGTCKRICPFYFSRNVIFYSDILVGDIKRLFSFKNINLIPKKHIRYGNLIFDNLYEIDGVNSDVIFFQMKRIMIDNSDRTLMLVKRKIITIELETKNLKNNKFNKFKHFFLDFSNDLIHKNNKTCEKSTSDTVIFGKKFRLKKTNGRIYHLIAIIKEINLFLRNYLNNSKLWKPNLKNFLKYLLKNSSKLEISVNYLKSIIKQLKLTLQVISVFENRIYSGLMKIGNFYQIVSLYKESKNENFRFFITTDYQKYDIIPEPVIYLVGVETSFLIKLIFEKFKTIIIFTNLFLDIKIYMLLIDCKPLVYGTINNFCLTFNKIPISVENEITNSKNKLIYNNIRIPRIYSLFINQVINFIPEGVLIFFSKYCVLEELIDEWKHDKVLKKILTNRKIFIETKNLKKNIIFLEEYKLCVDLGYNALFLGFYGGILYQASLEQNYSRTIFQIENNIFEFQYISNVVPVNFFQNQEKKKGQFWNNLIMSKESGFIFNKFFKSKKDFGLLVEIRKKYEKKTKSLNLLWNKFKTSEKDSKTCPAVRKIKNFFMKMF